MPRRTHGPRRPRPLMRTPSEQGHPRGLRGREIGQYYRNLNKQSKENKRWINLSIPQTVIADIYSCLRKIEKIAKTENIYFPPAKKLQFVAPLVSMDFIPIKTTYSDHIVHGASTIYKDDDVIYVKNNKPEVIEISDTYNNDTNIESSKNNIKEIEEIKKEDKKIKEENDMTKDKEIKKENVKIKKEIKEEDMDMSLNYTSNTPSTSFSAGMNVTKVETKSELSEIARADFSCSDTKVEIKTETYQEPGIFVSNNYIDNKPSTSRIETAQTSNVYKYSYDDIITGTFLEKLDECISQGIEINKRSEDIDRNSQSLKENHQHMMSSSEKYKKMLIFRQTLPTYKKASTILDVINKNQVIVISGETGCGKSTQVPQLILDNAFEDGRGANVKILVTEPRRIAASSLATRVAEERGEKIGTSVGYAVRLESVPCRERGSIMFCTTGVLLVELEQNQALSGYSHVILDEVHERDCQIDVAMCILKQVLRKRKDLKLILMSATIDADTLSKYYDDCPMLHIEGLAYPVKDVYMEEILAFTKFQLPQKPNFLENRKVWHKYTKKNRHAVSEAEKDMQYKASIASWLQPLKRDLDPNVFHQLQDQRIEELNLSLVLELLKYICRQEPGAILVFLPGIGDISKLLTLMKDSYAFPESSHEIYALHSKLPTIDQNKIFKKPPNGVRKIILATNIAETSITIDDVVYVIDCGKMKYKGLDVEKNHSTLQNEWISKANLRQRRGRAGRCQPGICYHLLTKFRAENIPDRLLPELQRSDLLEQVLCIKKLRLGKAEDALKTMPAVPAEKTIHTAIKHLQQVGALDESETLTPLGWHLARLPVHPAAGKLLILGCLFGCVNRAASVAAVWGFKDPFQLVLGKESEVDQARHEFALGEPSDHVAISEAIIQWEHTDDKWSFARHYFLSMNTLKLLSDMKHQFANNLKSMGFLNTADIKSTWENRNEDNLSLFKAVVAAALYPNIGTVRWKNINQYNVNKPLSIKAFLPDDGKVSMHPSSVLHTKNRGRGGQQQPICRNPGANWLVYWLKQKSTELFLLDVTCVYTLPLVFFGDLNFTKADNPDECLISISTLKVCCRKETAELLLHLRSLLDIVLTSKITHTTDEASKKHFEFDHQVLNAVIDLIVAEDEGIQYLGGDDDDDDDYSDSSQPNQRRRY